MNCGVRLTAGEVSQKYNLELKGDAQFTIDGVADPTTALPSHACFVSSIKYLNALKTSQARCWVLTEQIYSRLDHKDHESRVFLISKNPYLSFVGILEEFYPKTVPKPGVHKFSDIDPTARIHESCQIESFVHVGAGSQIGKNVILHSGVFVGEGVEIGEGSVLYSGAKIYHHCLLGKRVVIHSGAVIGADGFGFITNGEKQEKIPQVGRVVLGDDVEVGANSAIDRGTLADTIVGDGTKIDNLVQIGHNCRIGKNVIICAFAGISGNTTIGDNCLLAGQSATKGHLKIGNNVQVAGRSGVSKDIPDNSSVKGYPASPLKEYLKVHALYWKLPEIYERLKKLEGKK